MGSWRGELASTVPSPDPLLVGTRRYVLVQTGSKYFCRKMFCNMLQIPVMFAIALLRESSFNMTRGG